MNYLPNASFLFKLLCIALLVLIVLQYMFGYMGTFNRRWNTLFVTHINSNRDPDVFSEYMGTKHHGPFSDILLKTSSSTSSSSSTYNPRYIDGNSTVSFTNITSDNTTSVPLCPPIPPNLDGRVTVRKKPVPLVEDLEKRFNWLQPGGHYTPTNCHTQNRVAIIVPYRARAEILLLFLQHMHPFLKKQQIEYTIFIIEQSGRRLFNRAKLMNVGFKEALKIRDFDCFIFHDVDLLPEDDRNLYTCPEQPRHMSAAVDVLKYKLPYATIFGGVTAFTKEQFLTVNGFSNSFWGWGGEDDDMANRVKYHNLHISRYPLNIARYIMLPHRKQKHNPGRNPDVYNEHMGTKHRGRFLDLLMNPSSRSSSTYYPVYIDGNSTVPFTNITSDNTTSVPLCPSIPPNLDGRVAVRKEPVPSIQDLEKRFNWLQPGGHYIPTNCLTQYRVAIIVPYRARAENLLLFLQHMHPFLKKQQIEYTIFIIEQSGEAAWNKGKLMNAGFKEALKIRDFDCFIFHDVDLLPEDDRNLYTCPEQPRHMSVAVDVFKYTLPYSWLFGGVAAFTKQQFLTVNGYSNSFLGWGGEDDDMSRRIKYHKLHISRYPVNIARYIMLPHQKQKANPKA